MKLANNLYDLIHSLNKSEKGYFVKFAQSQGDKSDYLQLFHALYQLPIYNQEALKKEFKGAGFLKNIAYSQNYLYRMILKSLRLYYEKQRIEIQLYAALSEISILEIKNLKKQSAALLKSTKKKALTHHQYHILLEILKKQASQLVATQNHNLLEETQDVYKEIFEVLNILEEEFTYRKLSHSILLCFRHGASTTPDQFSGLLKSISDHPLMNDNVYPHSFFSQYLKYHIRCIEAKIYGDRMIAYNNHLKILEVWGANPEIAKANPRFYKIHISNFLGNAILLNKVKEFETYVEIMEGLETKNLNDKIETFQNIVYFRLLFFLNQNQLEEGKKYIESVEKKIMLWAKKLNHARAVAIYYNILVLYFLAEHFEKAQHWANLILDEEDKGIRRDVKFFARIMKLIIHFELNHHQLLDYLYTSIKRQLVNNNQKDTYKKTILTHFKSLINAINEKEKMQAYIRFKNDLIPFKELEPEPISIDEILIWLDARIERKSLRELYERTIPKG